MCLKMYDLEDLLENSLLKLAKYAFLGVKPQFRPEKDPVVRHF